MKDNVGTVLNNTLVEYYETNATEIRNAWNSLQEDWVSENLSGLFDMQCTSTIDSEANYIDVFLV